MARLLLNRFSQQTLADLCRELSRWVLATPLKQLETIGIPRVLVILTDDIALLGWAAQNVPAVAMHMAMLLGCAVYLAWLSWRLLMAIAVVAAIGVVGHRLLTTRAGAMPFSRSESRPPRMSCAAAGPPEYAIT